MNTVAEFHELILQDEHAFAKIDSKSFVMQNGGSEFDEEAPSLVLSCSSSSLDDSLCSFRSIQSSCSATARDSKNRSVRFNERVEVTEYSLSVGDHPICTDGLPLSLGWAHAEPTWRHIDSSKYRGYRYEGAPRLSLQQRRRRLRMVGETEDDKNCTPLAHLEQPCLLSAASIFAMVDYLQSSLATTLSPSEATSASHDGADEKSSLVPSEVTVIQV